MPTSEHSQEYPRPEDEEVQQNKEEKKQEKRENKAAGNGSVIIAIVCLIVEAIIFLFCVVGTPVDAFRAKSKVKPRQCYSMWGKKTCGAHKNNPDKLPHKGFPSSKIRSIMNAAAAFSIISIFFTLVAMILAILLVCKCMPSFIAGIFSIIAFISTLIVWACQAGVYYKKYDYTIASGAIEKRKIKDDYHYYASFGLFVTAWCLQTIEMVLVFFA